MALPQDISRFRRKPPQNYSGLDNKNQTALFA
jgi:hypothetical protein